MKFHELKRLNRNGDLKKALQGMEKSLRTAWLRFTTEEPEMSQETADKMRTLFNAVQWLNKNIDRDSLNPKDEKEQAIFDYSIRTLQNAGHILNDPVGGMTARNYLTQPDEDTEQLEKDLLTLQNKLGFDFSIGAEPYSGVMGHRYYEMLTSEGDVIRRQNQYVELGNLISKVAQNIKFDSLQEKKDFYETIAALGVLGLNKGMRTKLKDEEKNEAVVEILNETQALKKLYNTNLDAFFSKKHGNSKLPLITLMREAKNEAPEKFGNLSDDLDEEIRGMKEMHRKPAVLDNSKTAAEWIEEIKKTEEIYGFDPEKSIEDQGDEHDGYYYNSHMMAMILAARDLAGAKKGSRKELDRKVISEEELLKKAKEFEEEKDLLTSAFNSMSDYDLKSVMKGSGHCGALDESIRNDLLQTAPGRLSNGPCYRHFMPTVKDRIEYLQSQAQTGDDEKKIRAAAEIVVLRNLAHAHRGKKSSLNKPIPVSASNSLLLGVTFLASDPSFRNLVLKTPVRNVIGDGHGGDMVDKMRKYAAQMNADPKKSKHLNADTMTLLNGNTLGGHMELLRRKADDLQAQLDKELKADFMDRNLEKLDRLKEESEKLLMEYHLCNQEMHKTVNGKELGPDANVPWINFDKAIAARNQDPRFQNLEPNFNPESMKNILQHLAVETPEEFFSESLNKKSIRIENPEKDELLIEDKKGGEKNGNGDENENEEKDLGQKITI